MKVTVLEFKTNAAVQGATLDFYKQWALDFLNWGCYLEEKYASAVTDPNGICSISQPNTDPAPIDIKFSKANYYPKSLSVGQNVVEAIGQINMHLMAAQSHPETFRMVVYVAGEIDPPTPTPNLFLPQDSVVPWQGYGDQINTFFWKPWVL